MVDADSSDPNRVGGHSHRLQEIPANRLTSFGAQATDSSLRVIAREGSQIHQGNGLEEPSRLPLLLDTATCPERSGATFDRTTIHPEGAHPVHVEARARIAGALMHIDWAQRSPF